MITLDDIALLIYLSTNLLDDKPHDIVEKYSITKQQVLEGNKILAKLQEKGYSIYDLDTLKLELSLDTFIGVK